MRHFFIFKIISIAYVIRNDLFCKINQQLNKDYTMNQLSDRLNSLSPSATLAMSQKSSELKQRIKSSRY